MECICGQTADLQEDFYHNECPEVVSSYALQLDLDCTGMHMFTVCVCVCVYMNLTWVPVSFTFLHKCINSLTLGIFFQMEEAIMT